MTRGRIDGLILVLLGCAVFLLAGIALEQASPAASIDFKLVYYSARCLLQHRDPYQEAVLKNEYHLAGENATEQWSDHPLITKFLYPPTAFLVTVPFALFTVGVAHGLWLLLTAGIFILAALLMWDVGARHAPVVSGALAGLALANSELFLILGNPSGLVIGLCVIAAWCIIVNRYPLAGMICFALALMMKPQVSGPLWLYFLIAGGVYRRRALQALGVLVALSIPTIVWVASITPDWRQELHTLLVQASLHGAMNDPGQASVGSHGIGMVISLQAAFSLLRDDPRFYDAAAYAICIPLLLLWLVKSIRTPPTSTAAWYGLAPLAGLSLLPVYHRVYDAGILLLLIPACAMLWTAGKAPGRLALLLSVVAIVLTGAIPWALFLQELSNLHLPAELNAAVQVIPVPLILLSVGVFYLWIYLYSVPGRSSIVRARNPAD